MPSIINATTTNGLAISPDNSGSLQLATNNGTTAVTIDTSQNVGIGTSSPTQKLDIASKVQINTSNSYGRINIARATDSGLTALYIQGADNAGTTNELSLVNAGGVGSAINIGSDIKFYVNSNTTERMRIASDGTISTTIGSTLYGAYSARAWVNFNGTGTVAIRTSRNVSSITDNGTGHYTINLTTDMPDVEYSAVMSCGSDNTANTGLRVANALTNAARTTSSIRVGVSSISNGTNRTSQDDAEVSVAIFR